MTQMTQMQKKIFLCAISNVSSGNCGEDCKFCTQSAYFDTDINKYKYKDENDVLNEAKLAYKNKSVGFCLV
ncbi:MAG: Biotin synthase (EC, partial [uncultured Campylobacterales bacterium]